MVVSYNSKAPDEAFLALLKATQERLFLHVSEHPCPHYTPDGFEELVYHAMVGAAQGTMFADTIQLVSGHSFPDIVARHYYGVEVKMTLKNHWKTVGNSVLESCRNEGVERIYLMFGKFGGDVSFKYRLYQDCLVNVAVTHSPRYVIDMNLPLGASIFDKMAIPYDTIRKAEQPISLFVDYYQQQLKSDETPAWWMSKTEDSEEQEHPLQIRFWKSLDKEERKKITGELFYLFPEVFERSNAMKYERCAVYLIKEYSVLNPSMRDIFSAGGRTDETFNGRCFPSLASVFRHFNQVKDAFARAIVDLPDAVLRAYGSNVDGDPFTRLRAWHTKMMNVCGRAELIDSMCANVVAEIKKIQSR